MSYIESIDFDMRRAAVLSTTIGGGALYLSSEEKRRDIAAKVRAVGRIGCLVTTVGRMTASYSAQMLKDRLPVVGKSALEEEYLRATELLKELQEDQERDTILQLTTEDNEVRDAMERKIMATRSRIDETSELIATLSTSSGYDEVHRANAIRLRDMCAKNCGVYIKLGQHLAMLDYVLPEQYTEELSTLLANTPTTSWEGVTRVIKEDLGLAWSELFIELSKKPIASASLAQVHVGTLKNGKKVAVKVQHEGLREESHMDMKAITLIVDLVSGLFEGFTYQWLSKEMNDNLPKELDFSNEKANLLKAKDMLRGLVETGDLVIPAAHDQGCSARVLTMDYEEGVYVTDLRTIKDEWGLDTGDISTLVSTTFCEQMYRHGFVHCDPHEGNILVRPHPTKRGKPSIVLLDHGLYKELGNTFRMQYCRLWRGLVMGDEGAIRETCDELNCGKAYTLLAAMLTMRPWDDIVHKDRNKLRGKNTKGESEMLKAYAQKYFKEIVGLLGRVDNRMLLLLKTNDCLRHLDKKLQNPVNTTKIVASVTADVLVEEEKSTQGSLQANWTWCLVQSRVYALYFINKWLSWSA